jgi:predicted RNase H-like HicB family nuclease
MGETLQLTIVYEDGGDGWIVASIPEVPGAHSQGHTRTEARENAIDALHGILELRFGEHALSEPAADSEALELTIAASSAASSNATYASTAQARCAPGTDPLANLVSRGQVRVARSSPSSLRLIVRRKGTADSQAIVADVRGPW